MASSVPPDDSDLSAESPNADPIAQENSLRAGAEEAKRKEVLEYAGVVEKRDPYAALRFSNYRKYMFAGAFGLLGGQMMGVAVGWELYARTNSMMALGLVGLVQILPIFALFLPAGHVVDRVNRRNLVMWCQLLQFLSALGLGMASLWSMHLPAWLDYFNGRLDKVARAFGESHHNFNDRCVPLIFALLLFNGVVRAFAQPARSSLLPQLVPQQAFANAVTWNASTFETCSVTGPMIAGWVIGLWEEMRPGSSWIYASIYFTTATMIFVQLMLFSGIKLEYTPRVREPMTMQSLLAGVRWVFYNKKIYGAIALDMFAVLLGGATALLPVFAKDVLHAGPAGFAALRAAPSVGAITMALYIAHAKPFKSAGSALLWAVVGFGFATIVFGLSRNFWLSLAALFFTGVFDNVSVVIRQSLVQILTPDEMRGRVSAVNAVFISTSNELGAFESGTMASLGRSLFGTVVGGATFSVVFGGVGTIAVVGVIAWLYPQLRRVGKLEDLKAGT